MSALYIINIHFHLNLITRQDYKSLHTQIHPVVFAVNTMNSTSHQSSCGLFLNASRQTKTPNFFSVHYESNICHSAQSPCEPSWMPPTGKEQNVWKYSHKIRSDYKNEWNRSTRVYSLIHCWLLGKVPSELNTITYGKSHSGCLRRET